MVRVLAALMVALAVAGPAAGQSTCAHRLFVSNYFSTVRVFDACTGEYLRDLDAPTRIRGAQAVKLGPDGLLYVTSEMSQEILRYRNDTLDFVDVFADGQAGVATRHVGHDDVQAWPARDAPA